MSNFSASQTLFLDTCANYLNAVTLDLIKSSTNVEDTIAKISDLVDTTASDIPTIKVDPREAFLWMNKVLLRKGYLGKYLGNDFFPLKMIANINPDNYELAQDLVKQAHLDELAPPGTEPVFNPVLAKLTVPDQPRMGTAPKPPPLLLQTVQQ